MASSATITILDARLRLVHVPRDHLSRSMAPILECWWFRGPTDPFFALTVNALEVSLFADADVVRKTFGDYMLDISDDEDDGDDDHVDDAASDESSEADSTSTSEADRACAGDSGFTLGSSSHPLGSNLLQAGASLQHTQRQKELLDMDAQGQDRIKVGDDIWIALEIAFHGDGWEESGQRVRELSSPLADAGISIMFESTYGADYILVKASSLEDVTSILQHSGFQFNAPDDSDDEILSPIMSAASVHSGGVPSRQNSLRMERRGDSSSPGMGRLSNSMSGSLTLSETGSVGSKGSGTCATMSRSASAARAAAANVAHTHRGRYTSEGPPLPPTHVVAPLSPPQSAPTSPPPGASAALAPLPPPDRPPFVVPGDDRVALLPDELVCVGLAQGEQENLWRSKIVAALFYPERVLPRAVNPSRHSRVRTSSVAGSNRLERGSKSPLTESFKGATPTGRDTLSPARHEDSIDDDGDDSDEELRTSSVPLLSTAESGYPVPFIALTQTIDGTSLTADVRLLRAVFSEREEADMVYVVGAGGLRGVWQGEAGQTDGDDDYHEADQSDLIRRRPDRRGRHRIRTTTFGGDEDSPSHCQQSLSPELAAAAAEWEQVERDDVYDEQRRDEATPMIDGGRVILKVLQIDLKAFGLDKHGIVESVAGILAEKRINCQYTSAYSSANILVAKHDIGRAQRAIAQQDNQA